MPIEKISRELERDYGLLENAPANLPERQRNLKSLFDKTWQGLSEKKQETLAKFSIFQGGCSLEAAEEVTDARFTILLSLVNESLLKRIPPKRFDMHMLLKEFAKKKLEQQNLVPLVQEKHLNFSNAVRLVEIEVYRQRPVRFSLDEQGRAFIEFLKQRLAFPCGMQSQVLHEPGAAG